MMFEKKWLGNFAVAGTILFGVLLLGGVSGCASPQSTRLQAADFDETIAKMAQSLAASDFLKDRNASSPAVWVVINKVENLTTDLIPVAEQWMLVARLQSAMPIAELGQTKNVRFQITPERYAMLREAGFEGDLSASKLTTHTLTAVFMSAPRSARQLQTGQLTSRADYYYLEYTMRDIHSGEIVWNDTFEIKRVASGLAID